MRQVTEIEVKKRLDFDNPWWVDRSDQAFRYRSLPRRGFFDGFHERVSQRGVNRAVVLMGPRRVGKTVMVHHSIEALIRAGTKPDHLLYLSLDTPIYTGLGLERIVHMFMEMHDHSLNDELTVFFDEVQYLKDWEVHLKSLVDSFPAFRFVVTGSAAAALRLKSRESGAGRFTEVLLPPLTFAEYLDFVGVTQEVIASPTLKDLENLKAESIQLLLKAKDIDLLNKHFIAYVNAGGYPEAVLSEEIRANAASYIKSDIIDKVLLRDLPSLYGIDDIQELNRLFNTLAYNTGNELSLEGLSKDSGVSKNTIRKYLDYLEAAFLISRVHRVDENARRFKRATKFKVYLTNTSMRAALFGPLDPEDAAFGNLVETAIFGQLSMLGPLENVHYARWKRGEVDLVELDMLGQSVSLAAEIKWSDRPIQQRDLTASLREFMDKNPKLKNAYVTTRTKSGEYRHGEHSIFFLPSAVAVYWLGRRGFLYWGISRFFLHVEELITDFGKKLTPNRVEVQSQ
ncbi:MAG: ATP-binding protein [Gammaproteobacteria bacterium]